MRGLSFDCVTASRCEQAEEKFAHKERERERETETETERQRQRQTQTQTDRQTGRQTDS